MVLLCVLHTAYYVVKKSARTVSGSGSVVCDLENDLHTDNRAPVTGILGTAEMNGAKKTKEEKLQMTHGDGDYENERN